MCLPSCTFIEENEKPETMQYAFSSFLIFPQKFSRPYHTHDIEEALDQEERSSSGTLTPDYRDPTFSYLNFSNSNEEQHSTLPIHQLEGSTAHTINILGSLCLRSVSENDSRFEDQGIYQGLMMGNQYREMLDVFPDALCMTVNLEQHQAELEGLSVQVTKKTEIVPQTPFECGVSNTRKRYSGECGMGRGFVY